MRINFLKKATVEQTLKSLEFLGLDTFEEDLEDLEDEDVEYIGLEDLVKSFNKFIRGNSNYSDFIDDYLEFASHFSSQYGEDYEIGEYFIDGHFTCSLNDLLKFLDYLEKEGIIKIEH